MTFGEWHRSLRMRKGLTLSDVAKAARYSIPYLCDVEYGRRSPPRPRTGAWAKILGISTKTLAKKASDGWLEMAKERLIQRATRLK